MVIQVDRAGKVGEVWLSFVSKLVSRVISLIKFCCLGTYLRLSCVSVELLRRVGWLECAGRGGGPGVGIVALCSARSVWRWSPGPDRWCPGPLPAHVNPTGGSVGAPPTLPPQGPSCAGRAGQATGNPSQTSVGPSCADVGGIATIGGSGRRVVGVSRAYGSNFPRLEPGRRRGSFDNEAQQSQFPRLEPGRHAPMRRRPRRSPRSAHCYVSETLPAHPREGPYRACA